ncbi:hypothetical protein FB446DRAFT_819192 [Lentinula raphanica]|nr:hypothetical protein EV360DRAFT_78235 [Lentinula raphanica]KAJ3776286.1 hypothetical protein FB446DRAFT_819192 [Lentinula raphanica]
MPSFTSTVEDYSPVVIYSSDWQQGSSQTDTLSSSYSGSSFFATSTTGGTASFTFNGTGVELFGSKRGNHGLYQVTIDGTTFPAVSGESTDPGIFQTSLFSKTDLKQGLHTVVLENQGSSGQFVDLDFITWHGSIGEDNEKLLVSTVQDDDSSFVYSPDNAWSNSPDNLGFFSGSSGHVTSTPGASLTYSFEGKLSHHWDGVSLYGPVGPAYAPFAIQINGDTLSFSAQKSLNASQTLLYHTDGLGPGSHTLKLLFQPSATGQILAIDYAEVYTTSSITSSSSTSGSHGRLSGGAIAGLVIGLLALCAIFAAGFWYYLRRRKARNMRRRDGPAILESELGTKPVFELPNPYHNISGPAMYEYRGANPINGQSRLIGGPEAATTFMDFASTHTSSIADDRSDSSSQYAVSTRSLTRSIANSTSPRRIPSNASSVVQTSSKGHALFLPNSAGESLSGVPVEQLKATRMVVNGRPQDFGSLSEQPTASGSNVGPSPNDDEHHPPPDYHQATETYNGPR